MWSVTLNVTTTMSASAPTPIVFPSEPNGSYPFTVGAVPGYTASPSSGVITVNNMSVSKAIQFAPIAYPVTFTETGLPAGTMWSVTLGGSPMSSMTNTIVFDEPNGNYAFTVGNVPGFSASPSSGNINVNNGPANQAIAFSQNVYAVTFTETGLPSGTSWSVTLAGSTRTSPTNTITFSEPDGQYSFTVGAVSGYSSSPSSGTVTVSGGPTSQAITFSQILYAVTFSETGLPSGNLWGINLSGTVHAATTPATVTFQEPDGTYPWIVVPFAGYTATPSSDTVTVHGAPLTVQVSWRPTRYFVNFTEVGLPNGISWSVTILPTTLTGITPNALSFQEPAGTWQYTVHPIAGYATHPYSGTVDVTGNVVVQTNWTVFTWTVTFFESGLPANRSWTVNLNGAFNTSVGPIRYQRPNGTYPFSVVPIPGYHASVYSGNVFVNGADLKQNVSWTRVTYNVTFIQNTLPNGTRWLLTLNGTTRGSMSSSLTFTGIPNGSQPFYVNVLPGYVPNPASGVVRVSGASLVENISFAVARYTVTFAEAGLPPATKWSINLSGVIQSSTAVTMAFPEGNGTFGYSVGVVPGYFPSPASGTVTVSGSPASVTVTWALAHYTLTFQEFGLPAGTAWLATLAGQTLRSTANTIVFTVGNGTFSFAVGPVDGYSPRPSSGFTTVSGGNEVVQILFSTGLGGVINGPCVFLGLSCVMGYALVAGLVVAAALFSLFLVVWLRKPKGPLAVPFTARTPGGPYDLPDRAPAAPSPP